jgi:putative peptidoglycan lipid II flippase
MVPLQNVGPPLATSLAAIFNVCGLGMVLARRGLLRLDAQLQRRALRMVLATGAMGVSLWLAQEMLFAAPLHGVARLGTLAARVGGGLPPHPPAAAGFGAGDWRAVGRIVGRRMARRTGARG